MEAIVIFVGSYLQYKNALYIATQNYQKRTITIIILGNSSLHDFFSAINQRIFQNSINLKFFDYFRTDPRRVKAKGLNRVFYVLSDIIKERRYLKDTFYRYIAGIRESEIYLLDRGALQFFLANKLSKKNRLVYFSSYPTNVAPKHSAVKSIDNLVRLIIYKLTYGCDIALGEVAYRKGIPHMPDKFLKQKVARVIYEEERDGMLQGFDMNQFKVFDVGKYSVIYLDDNLINSDFIADKNVFRKEITGIFDLVSKYYPENEIARKYHAGYNYDKTVITLGDVLPDYIPAELLYNDNIKMYLGDSTTALANVEKGLAVSILRLISFKDEQTREELAGVLQPIARSKLLFPKSLEEFEGILVSLCSNR